MSSQEVASSSGGIVQSTMQAFRCTLCYISFDSALLLRRHMESKHKKISVVNKPFDCKVCRRKFSTKINLVKHVTLKRMCLKIYRTKYSEALEDLVKKAPVETLPVVQQINQNQQKPIAPINSTLKLSASNDEQQANVDKSSPPTTNSVAECNKDSSSMDCVIINPQSFERPLNQEYLQESITPKLYSCGECGYLFNSKATVRSHKRNGCQKLASSADVSTISSNLPLFDPNEHIVTSSTSDGEIVLFYKCPNCIKIFQKSNHLIMHMRSHNSTKTYSCNFCDMKYNWKNTLKAHVKRVHGESSQQVQLQDKSSMSAGLAEEDQEADGNHISGCITPLITYKCSQCPKKFSSKESSDLHESTHVSEKLFTCVPQVQLEDEHSMWTGSAEEDHEAGGNDAIDNVASLITYNCSQCSKEFSSKESLGLHERTHVSEKLFTCERCGKECKVEGSLRLHIAMNPQCQQSVSTPPASAIHKKKDRTTIAVPNKIYDGRAIKCPYCLRCFQTTSSLRSHLYIHKSAIDFFSSNDESKYANKSIYIRRMKLQYHKNVLNSYENTPTSGIDKDQFSKSPTTETVSTLLRSEGNDQSGRSSSSTTSDIDDVTQAESVNLVLELNQSNDVRQSALSLNISASVCDNADVLHPQISNGSHCPNDKMLVEESVQKNKIVSTDNQQSNASFPPLVTTAQPFVLHNQPLPMPGFYYPLNFASFTQNTGSNLINVDGQGIGNNQVNQFSVPTMAAPYYFMPYCFPFNQMQQMPAPYNLGSFGQTAAVTLSHCANQGQGLGVNNFAHNPMLPQNWGFNFYQNPGMMFPIVPNLQQSFKESDIQPKSVGSFSIENILK